MSPAMGAPFRVERNLHNTRQNLWACPIGSALVGVDTLGRGLICARFPYCTVEIIVPLVLCADSRVQYRLLGFMGAANDLLVVGHEKNSAPPGQTRLCFSTCRSQRDKPLVSIRNFCPLRSLEAGTTDARPASFTANVMYQKRPFVRQNSFSLWRSRRTEPHRATADRREGFLRRRFPW
jgi:hypothetical protein